jgi:Resolvase, N terminal domain
MSSSIVHALRVFGMHGARGVLVIALALGLFLAVAAAMALWQPMRRHAGVVMASLGQGPRALGWLSAWPRGMRAGRAAVDPVVEENSAPRRDGSSGVAVIGYATLSRHAGEGFDEELAKQAEVIARACDQRGLVLVEVVREPPNDPGPVRSRRRDGRPALQYAMARIAAGEAQGLVVSGLRRLARSAAELGPIVAWFTRREARLVAVAQGLDTAEREGRVAARLLIEVSRWEQERLGDSAHPGVFPRPSPSGGVHDVAGGGAGDLDDLAAISES